MMALLLRLLAIIGFCGIFEAQTIYAENAPLRLVEIQVEPQSVMGRISPDFIGFGYETSAVAQTNYFSANNPVLIQLYRNLSTQGLIRIGGNISDHTRYEPEARSIVHSERNVTIINHKSVVNLGEFARATGWKVMWGLNFGTGTKAEAVQEAKAVAGELGDHLQSFEIGNEVDIHGHYTRKYRDFNSYYSNYLAFKTVIQEALPSARFSGPDVAWNTDWLQRFANKEGHGAQLLTHHYYRTGANRPDATIKHLLEPDKKWLKTLDQLHKISTESGVPFRINEVNSFYGGGKAGVSDTFASALWALDYMFTLASHDCNGINLETDINQLKWISHYSPIVHDTNGTCHARPEYYGMLAFSLAGKGDLLKLKLDKDNINLSAYATRSDHTIWIVVVNKDLERNAGLTTVMPAGYNTAHAFRLKAPTVTSTNGVSFAGNQVQPDGQWHAGYPEIVPVKRRAARLLVPHASAVLLQLKP